MQFSGRSGLALINFNGAVGSVGGSFVNIVGLPLRKVSNLKALRRLKRCSGRHTYPHLKILAVRHYVIRHNGIADLGFEVQSVPLFTMDAQIWARGSRLTSFRCTLGYLTTPKYCQG